MNVIMNVIWKPQKKQEEFMRSSEYEVLYGGAAGGGKSEALVAEALRQVHLPHYKAIIFRKTFPQLRELIDKSQRIYKQAFPDAEYNSTEHVWKFPSGAKIYFGSMPNRDSYLNYQGLSFAFIGFDELTHFTQEEYEYLISRNRADGDGEIIYIRSTANPGGVGHGWVKERFISAAPPNTKIEFKVNVTMPDGSVKELVRTRKFVPSSVFDNAELMKNDPNYIANLASLPEAKRKALLYGDWDSFTGQVFTEWSNHPENEGRKNTHVIKPFPIPRHWRRYRSFDFGYSKPFAVQWWAIDEYGRAYLYRQMYGCTDTPNTGIKKEPSEIARAIKDIEDAEERGLHIIGIADPAIWDESRGKNGTIITMFENEGVYFEKGDNKRLPGKMQVHKRLRFDSEGYPMMYVFETCREFIRTIPNLVYDPHKIEDIDTDLEDHDYDAMRYFFMTCPLASQNEEEAQIKVYDPFNRNEEDRRVW